MSRLNEADKRKVVEWLTSYEMRWAPTISRQNALRMCTECHVKIEKLEKAGILSAGKKQPKGDHDHQRLIDVTGFVVNHDLLKDTTAGVTAGKGM